MKDLVAAETIYILLGFGAAMYIAWNLGANDSANPTNMAVAAGAINIRKAILLFGLFAAIGALLQGYMVIKTIGKGVVLNIPPLGALVASIVAGLWITFATYKGLPVSTTHSSVGAVLGIGLSFIVLEGDTQINLSVVYKVVLSWIASPISAILLSMLFYFLFSKLASYLMKKGYNVDSIFRKLFIPGLAFAAYAFGSNDVGNATGVYVSVVRDITGLPDRQTMLFLALMGSVGIVIGAYMWGPRVIETIGFKITKLDYVTGLAAQLSVALSVWIFTTIPSILFGFGMPISTTHASVSSVIGAGIAKTKSLRGLNWRTVAIIVASWVLTLPITAGISFALFIILKSIGL